jgi:hypothetical protein
MPTKERTMSPSHIGERRHELAHRSNYGVHVSLLWCPADDSLAVTVLDVADTFEISVQADEALEVFNHPYAYAAFRDQVETADIAA